jgi:7-cyano-7-deazaguanine synthase in queuosine biosynthesis
MECPAGGLRVILYGQPRKEGEGSAGEAAKREVLRRKFDVAPRAWDFLSIALSVVTADFAEERKGSPDGWTREFDLDIAVSDPTFWNEQSTAISLALGFLTTDRWSMRFHAGGAAPLPPNASVKPIEDCVVLLSGGLDSVIGAIDLVADGRKPFAVSQTVRGDADKQCTFAASIGGGLSHLQLNHNAQSPGEDETSQRARSLVFIAFGVLLGTALKSYHDGDEVPLFVCENGLIAINPALTGSRIGSLSTRTAHPEFIARLQGILDNAGLRVRITNPYQAVTKGEMLQGCKNQATLRALSVGSTSCGRYQRYGYKHCGRCIPCQVRRAAFLAWGEPDNTGYVFEPLGKSDEHHAGFDDVRSVAMAILQMDNGHLEEWLGAALSSPFIPDRNLQMDLVRRGLLELKSLHTSLGVK